MAPRKDPRPPGTVVEWVDIHGDGTEVVREGVVHSAAPAFGLLRSWWVVPAEWLPDVLVASLELVGPVEHSAQLVAQPAPAGGTATVAQLERSALTAVEQGLLLRVIERRKRGPVGRATEWSSDEVSVWNWLSGSSTITRPTQTRWRSAGGRVVERGTIYREVDARSLLAQSTTKLRKQHERG